MSRPARLPSDQVIYLPGGETAGRTPHVVAIQFPGPRHVLCTSWQNGGYREDLASVFNHQIPLAACEACHNGGSVREYLEHVAGDIGLDPATTSGLVTRADMVNTAVVSETFRDLTVTAVVTAGIDKNGGRAGDPASYYENGDSFEPLGGTINTILIIGADLPEHALSRALMTATEAKAATLQQLIARSIYSSGIATGSGTDMIAIVADPLSPLHLTDAGKHAKLGELIGLTVMQATTAALEWETGLSPASQANALVRLSRFGVTEEDLWHVAVQSHTLMSGRITKKAFFNGLHKKAREPGVIAVVSAGLHLLDEVTWELVPKQETTLAACHLIREGCGIKKSMDNEERSGSAQESILSCLNKTLTELVIREIYNGNSE